MIHTLRLRVPVALAVFVAPFLWTASGGLDARGPRPRGVPAVQVDTVDVTLVADKPTVVKPSQAPIGLIRVAPKTLTSLVNGQAQVVDFTQPDAYAFVYGPSGGKKMPATYFTVPSNPNLRDSIVDVQLVGRVAQQKAPFECLLPTKFDDTRGFVLNARVENNLGVKNCTSADKGFKVVFEYNVK